ncbi:EMP24 [Symbiodinium natans]|uniref:EMP24 protein n=1 Tax=Symbiodinium natans TaxID=878477 RepID=A0A812PDZ9_9DINO|nr:EMP24 [Symbiodinium natans]
MVHRARLWLLAALPLQCTGLFFELKAKSAGPAECFKATPGHGHSLHGSYEADGPNEGVLVTLTSGSGKELFRNANPSGRFSIEVMEELPHRLCFESSVEESQMVSFNFHVDEHGDGTDHHDKEHMEYVTKEHTDKVEELVAKLEAKANDILDQQQYAITREAVHRETAESTNARVMWWTLAEVAVLISLAAFQVSYLRSHFEVKQIV